MHDGMEVVNDDFAANALLAVLARPFAGVRAANDKNCGAFFQGFSRRFRQFSVENAVVVFRFLVPFVLDFV